MRKIQRRHQRLLPYRLTGYESMNLGMLPPIHSSRSYIIHIEQATLGFPKIIESLLRLPLDSTKDRRHEPGGLRCAFAGYVDEGEWFFGVEGCEGVCSCEGVILRDFNIFPIIPSKRYQFPFAIL
ncbi:unnamed protein product [Periconia digitata]|uniref:Uncharacterized protein n=1 Tax=Periconia digitata TaxID=1303443 RepID=A0A9W4UV80_9PLEO|nr:unnamed protein product [Periconia digitata]